MKDKLKLLDLSKHYNIQRYDDDDRPRYEVRSNTGDCYAIIFDDGKIEYWGDTNDYYDFKIDIDQLFQLVDYVKCLKEE